MRSSRLDGDDSLDLEHLKSQVERLVRTGDTKRLKLVYAQLKAAVDRKQAAERTERWSKTPVQWAQDRLGLTPWSKQREIMESVRDYRKTVVRSAHSTGKSFCAAMTVAWWLDAHPPGTAFVVSSAPTAAQVRAILWRYIRRMHKENGLPGRVNQTEWLIDEELVAFGRKPADADESAFQGIHSPYVLCVLDEACHDDQTDVMTESGWKRFADLKPTDRLLTMDPSTHEARYRTPVRLIAKPYTGAMRQYQSDGVNFCVTPDHDMYVRAWSRGKKTVFRREQAGQFPSNTTRYIKKSIEWNAPDAIEHVIPAAEYQMANYVRSVPEIHVPMDVWCRFMGLWLSEGCAMDRGSVSITQTKDNGLLDEAELLFKEMGFEPHRYTHCIRVHDARFARHLRQYGKQRERWIPDDIRHASRRQLQLFWDNYRWGDGYRNVNRDVIYTSSRRMADHLQEIGLKLGCVTTYTSRGRAGDGNVMPDGHRIVSGGDSYTVSKTDRAAEGKILTARIEDVQYSGMVYCATLPADHLLLTRRGRNNRTMWSGNCGIPDNLWVGAEAITTGPECRILAIGNPDNAATHFYTVSQPGSGWNAIRISAFDSPNFTGEKVSDMAALSLVSREWVEEKKKEWGEENALYNSKVLGEFTLDSADTVVRSSDVATCRLDTEAAYSPADLSPVELGVDVGGGLDETVIRERRGILAGREWRLRSDRPEKIAPLVLRAIRESGATAVKIDSIGVGFGVIGELRNAASRHEHNARIIGVNVSENPRDKKKYANLRAEMWWTIGREMSAQGLWDLSKMENADITAAELLQPRWDLDTKGRIIIEPKDKIRDRTGKSPDHADALLLSYFSGAKPRIRILGG